MTPYEYLLIRRDPSRDTMPMLYFFWQVRKGKPLSFNDFNQLFSIWLVQIAGVHRLPLIINYVFSELDKYFAKHL